MSQILSLNSLTNRWVKNVDAACREKAICKFKVTAFNVASAALIGSVAFAILAAGHPLSLAFIFLAAIPRTMILSSIDQNPLLSAPSCRTKLPLLKFVVWLRMPSSATVVASSLPPMPVVSQEPVPVSPQGLLDEDVAPQPRPASDGDWVSVSPPASHDIRNDSSGELTPEQIAVSSDGAVSSSSASGARAPTLLQAASIVAMNPAVQALVSGESSPLAAPSISQNDLFGEEREGSPAFRPHRFSTPVTSPSSAAATVPARTGSESRLLQPSPIRAQRGSVSPFSSDSAHPTNRIAESIAASLSPLSPIPSAVPSSVSAANRSPSPLSNYGTPALASTPDRSSTPAMRMQTSAASSLSSSQKETRLARSQSMSSLVPSIIKATRFITPLRPQTPHAAPSPAKGSEFRFYSLLGQTYSDSSSTTPLKGRINFPPRTPAPFSVIENRASSSSVVQGLPPAAPKNDLNNEARKKMSAMMGGRLNHRVSNTESKEN